MDSLEARIGVLAVLAYVLGSIPFGVVFARARGIDLRRVGSGNIGATNAARALGARMGLLVFACDTAKGVVPVLVARAALPEMTIFHAAGTWGTALVGGAAFVGHLASPWLRFRGGKGVATAFGVMVALAPLAAFGAGAVFGVLYGTFRIVSVGSLAAATVFVPAVFYVGRDPAPRALAVFMWVLIVWRHRGNVSRLLHREEGRV